MRRVLAILITTSLLICCLVVPSFAAQVDGSSVDLFYWNADKSVKSQFTGSTVYLDEPLDPFQGQIKVVLSEEVEAGDYVDLELLYTATEGQYTITSIEIATSGNTYFDVFDYGHAEMDSTHVSIQSLGVDEKFYYSIGIVYINYRVSGPEYDESTSVIDGTPTKRYGFLMSVSDVNISGIGELGFFARILEGILNLPSALVEGIKDLFLPSQEEATNFRDKMDALLRDRLGPAYEASDIMEDFAYSMSAGAATMAENTEPATISMPALTVNLAGADFTFGGWEVRVIPEGFEDIVFVLKNVVNMVCTLAFVNALRDRLEGVLH